MPAEERLLPLFPLNTVLFPNASLPLQIFEERYKLMLQHCLESDSKFGVVLIKAGSEVGEPATPHSTGTVAHIVQVNRAQRGKIFIAVAGQNRFQVKHITQYQPYMAARVELLEDVAGGRVSPEEMEAIRQAVTEHVRLALGLRGGWVREVSVPSKPLDLSYFIARILQVGLQDKQALLEESSTSRRLETEMKMLGREVEGFRQRVALELGGRYSRQ